jgi:hypothetical protein
MQMRSILRTVWCSVKYWAHYRPLPRLLHPSAVPQEFLIPSSVVCPLQRIYFIRCCVPPHVGHTTPGRIPSHGTESCMECFHISLNAQAVGTTMCPIVASGVSSISTGSASKSSHWSAKNVPPLPAVVGLSFRPFLTCGAICTEPYRVGCVSCPSTAEGEGYVYAGTH